MVLMTFTTSKGHLRAVFLQNPFLDFSEVSETFRGGKGLQLVSVCLELAAIRSYLFKLLQAGNKHGRRRSRGKIKHWNRP